MTTRISRAVRATAECVQALSPEIRAQRARHFAETERRRRLEAARCDVDAARAALEKVRNISAEMAALKAAERRLADMEAEQPVL